MKRVWLRRLIWGVAILVGLALLIAACIMLSLDGLVRRGIRSSLERQTGVGVRLDGVKLGVRDGSFRLDTLILSNPPGFGPGALLSVPELYLRYDPGAATSNVLRIAEARVHLAEVNLIVDREGRTNLMELATGPAGEARNLSTNLFSELPGLPGVKFGGVDRLTLTLGRFTFRDERDARRNVTFDLGITNRTLTNITSILQFVPLAWEIGLQGGWEIGLPPEGKKTNPGPLR